MKTLTRVLSNSILTGIITGLSALVAIDLATATKASLIAIAISAILSACVELKPYLKDNKPPSIKVVLKNKKGSWLKFGYW